MRRLLFIIWVLLALGVLTTSARAQEDNESQTTPADSPVDLDTIAVELAELEQRIQVLSAVRPPEDDPAAETDVSEELALLQRLRFVLDLTQKLVPALNEVEANKIEVGIELAKIRKEGWKSDEIPSIRALDALKDELNVEEDGRELARAALQTARRARDEARANLDDRQRELRSQRDALSRISDPAEEAVTKAQLELTKLRERVASATMTLRGLQLEEATAHEQLHRGKVELLRAKVDAFATVTTLTEQELEEVLEELARETARLESDAADMQGTLTWIEARWMTASDRLAERPNASEEERQEVETLYQNKETSRYLTESLDQRIARLTERRLRWEQRLLVYRDELGDDEADTLIADLVHRRTDLHLEKTKARERLEPMRSAARALDAKLEEAQEGSVLAGHYASQKRHIERRLEAYEANIASMEVLVSLTERLLVDLRGEEDSPLKEAWREFITAVGTTWNYELGHLGDTEITIRKIVIGLLIVIIGIFLSRRISRFLGTRLLPGMGLEAPAATVVRTLLFYVLVLVFVFFALNFVDVPLTAFTVLGGALAVGIGFGSQNIVNNFISGIILLIEQPVRVGDLIQIGDLFGNVVRIGARSTHIRTGANVEIMVPNSSFLENNVVNLTLSDDKIRAFVEVGVAYGSPVRDVVKLLKRAASEHGRVLKHPEPLVLFESFGDNSLVFEVHFWIRARAVMDRRTIESDIRSKVDAVFRGSSIEIAFPQRDIHFDADRPLRVQVVPTEEAVETGGIASLGESESN